MGNADFDKSLDRAKAVYTLEQSENQQFGAIAVLECRGCEIVAFDPKVSPCDPSTRVPRPRAGLVSTRASC